MNTRLHFTLLVVLVIGSEGLVLVVHDLIMGRIRHTLRGHTNSIVGLNISPTEPIVASSSWDGTIRLWDLNPGACIQVLSVPGPYAGMTITDVTGISHAQKTALQALGAVAEESDTYAEDDDVEQNATWSYL